MDAKWIITVFVVIDDLMQAYGHQTDCPCEVSDSEILTTAVCAAKFYQNHHERTVKLMNELGYLSDSLSVSRFNRRLHRLTEWLKFSTEVLAQLYCKGGTFVIDSIPVPMCRLVRSQERKNLRLALAPNHQSRRRAG